MTDLFNAQLKWINLIVIDTSYQINLLDKDCA